MEQNDTMRAIILYQDKAALLKATYPAFIGLLVSLPLFVFALQKRRAAKPIVWMVSVALFFWELFYFSTWYRLLFPRPILVIDDEGITYQPDSPWFMDSDMTIRLVEMSKTGTFFMLPERMINPLKVDILLAQIIEQYQAEIESNQIQVLTEHKVFVS